MPPPGIAAASIASIAAANPALLWTADQPEVFALAVDRKGVVYAGTSPDGKVYRIENGRPAEYFAPHARYIWSLAAAPDGALYVGTGDQGKVFRVDAPGKGELYYDTGQSHITGLAVDAQGRLLAGTEPNGILYRITAKDKAFVLVRRQPAGDPRHRPHARWNGVRGGAGRLHRQAGAKRRAGGAGKRRGWRGCGRQRHHHGGSAGRPGRRNQAPRAQPGRNPRPRPHRK